MTSATVTTPDERSVGALTLEVASGMAAEMEVLVEPRLHLPTRIFGECTADHLRRGAPCWSDMPDEPPLGEEGGTAWTPDNAWLHEEE